MQHFGNECADHAAALGAFGFVSNHNFSTRWAYPSFDSNLCFAICHNFGVPTIFASSVSHVSHGDCALQIEEKESMHRETDRERKEKVL